MAGYDAIKGEIGGSVAVAIAGGAGASICGVALQSSVSTAGLSGGWLCGLRISAAASAGGGHGVSQTAWFSMKMAGTTLACGG